ncbi:ScyD/ScyE family protein [Cellulomonas sp. Marseille-Q8402]
MGPRRQILALLSALLLTLTPAVAASASHPRGPDVGLLASGLSGGAGSTVGPDGALYVAEPLAGEISRVDRRTGAVATYVSGLPVQVPGTPGGVVDVVFLGGTAYALVTLVGPDVGGTSTVGVYRVDGPASATPVADIGAFSLANPPTTDFFVPTGVQYAIEAYRGGFLVTDGHHNRVLRVTTGGEITQVATLGNVVPTGLETSGRAVWFAEAGPVPHDPSTGKVMRLDVRSGTTADVAVGGRLLVDVELGGSTLYALAQGVFTPGSPEGSPADPGTGELLRVTRDGGFRVVADGLDRPTSVEIVRSSAHVVTLDGEVWTVALDGRHGHGRG